MKGAVQCSAVPGRAPDRGFDLLHRTSHVPSRPRPAPNPAPRQIGAGVYLWQLSPPMAATTAGVATALTAVAVAYGAFTRRAQRTYQDALAASNSAAEEGFTLSRLVRSFGGEGGQRARYDGTLGALRRISIRQGAAYSLYVAANNFLCEWRGAGR